MMKNTDQNIQKLLVQTEKEYVANSELENIIMNTINTQENYAGRIVKTKRNAKIGIFVSIILLGLFGFVTYFELLNSTNNGEYSLKAFYPSIFTVIVVIVVYFEMTFGITIFKKVPNIKTVS